MKIGVFDSGVGGLSVLKSLLDSNLFSEIIYYGDTARVPYGNKDRATIVRFSLEALDFFAPHKIDMLIVACNTVSAHALNQMQEIAPFPIIGVVESGVLSLSNKIKNKQSRILIIATKATIESGIYEKNLRALGYENLISLQTGLFVPLVEEGIFEGEILEATFRHYFKDFAVKNLSLGVGNSPLDLHSADFANLGRFADFSPVSHPKFAKNHESQTENSSVVDSARSAESSEKIQIKKPFKSFCYFWLSPKVESPLPLNPNSPNNADSVNQTKSVESNAKKGTFALPNAIILGCTHFPLIQNAIKKYFDNKPILIHSGEAIVEFLKQKYELDSAPLYKNPKVRFYASADKNALEKTAKLWLKS